MVRKNPNTKAWLGKKNRVGMGGGQSRPGARTNGVNLTLKWR
jgi:hypothetical protein